MKMINIAENEDQTEDVLKKAAHRKTLQELVETATFYDQKETLSVEEFLDLKYIRGSIVDAVYEALGEERRSNPKLQQHEKILTEKLAGNTEELVIALMQSVTQQQKKLEKRAKQKLEADMLSRLELIKADLEDGEYQQIRATILHDEELLNSILLFEIAVQTIGPAKVVAWLTATGLVPVLGIKLGGAISFVVRPATLWYYMMKRGDSKASKIVRLPIVSDIYSFGNFLITDHQYTSQVYALIKMCLDEQETVEDYEKNKEFCDQYIEKNKSRLQQASKGLKSGVTNTIISTQKSLEMYFYLIAKKYFEIRNPNIPMSQYELLRRAQINYYRSNNQQDEDGSDSDIELSARKKLLSKIQDEWNMMRDHPQARELKNILTQMHRQLARIHPKNTQKILFDMISKYLKRLKNLNKKI